MRPQLSPNFEVTNGIVYYLVVSLTAVLRATLRHAYYTDPGEILMWCSCDTKCEIKCKYLPT